jgi:hypothetical protein
MPGHGRSASTSASKTEPKTTANKVILAFTGLPFRRLTEQPDRAARVVDHASDVAICCYAAGERAINSRRLGHCGRHGIAIADYRIICVVRRADGHLRSVGYSANGNAVMYDDLWSIEQARRALEDGHRLYTQSASGDRAELEIYGEGIRAKPDQGTRNTLDDLPGCG